MKRTVLLLLACLLLALRTVAQAPEKAVPDDLVVTAEIVGYSKHAVYPNNSGKSISRRKLRQYSKQPSKKYFYLLQAKMMIRNTTDHPRDISMMDCSWYESWLVGYGKGELDTPFFTGCDHNSPNTFTIPVGEAMVFNCPLIFVRAHVASINDSTSAMSFRLGFIDLTYKNVFDGLYDIPPAERTLEKIQKARAVYWSNALTTEIDFAAIKEIDGKLYPTEYHLTKGGKY